MILTEPKAPNDGQPVPESVTPRRIWHFIPLLGFIALLVWEIGSTIQQHHTSPQEKDWKEVASKIRVERSSGEPVLFAPLWVDPLGRQYLGDQLDLELLLLSDVDRFSRVWEVSIRGAQHPWLKGVRPARQWQFGQVTLTLVEKPAAKVLYDFTRSIRQAKVHRIGERVELCSFQHRRFVCDTQQSWNWVGTHLAEVGHQPYRCIYAHPVQGQLMRLSFAHVPLGKTLVGYTGIDDFENRKQSQMPVELVVKIDNQRIGAVLHQNHWPWHRFSLDTTTYAGSKREVRFETTAENTYARTFCFSAETRE